MAMLLTEEQNMLRESATTMLSQSGGVDALRALRDSGAKNGFSPGLWQSMCELGWAAIIIPEDDGGLGFGHVGMGQISEQCGRHLTASPLFASAIVSASTIIALGTAAQRQAWLPKIADGSMRVVLALDEKSRHDPSSIKTQLTPTDDGFALNGSKPFVADAMSASHFLVVANLDGQQRVVMLECEQKGVAVKTKPSVDSHGTGSLELSEVVVNADQILGDGKTDGAATRAALRSVLDVANAHLAAELLGMCEESFERTVAYLKERKQFGVPIGGFQALQHRAAILWTDIEMVKSVVLKALQALDTNAENASALCSAAKAKASSVAELATNEAVQMHGGVGMTDEYDLGFFMKRARAAAALYGDQRYHADRLARLAGY